MKSTGISIIKVREPENIAAKLAAELLDNDGYLKILPAAYYDKFPLDHLKLFCHYYARYGLPTVELAEFLKFFIGDRSALEIGAGCGDLGRALNIPMTDNFCQDWPEVKAYYALAGQPVIRYGKDIERLDALDAVKKYKPDVVIGQWVTHWIDPKFPPPPGGGSIYGVKEDLLLKECKSYIVIGNSDVHGHKPIRAINHMEVQNRHSTIRSRANDQSKNILYIWNETE